MLKIYLSPSDQTNNAYAYGNTTEAIQCRRIANACEKALIRCGFAVKNNQTSSMYNRVAESNAWPADLHVPIHTNAANGQVSGTRIFYGRGKDAALSIFNKLAPYAPGASDNCTQNAGLYEINSAQATTVYVEAEFHDVVDTAKWIIENVTGIGEKIAEGICSFFKVDYIPEDKPTPEPVKKISIKYQIWDDVLNKWLPNVIDTEDYAGLFRHDVCCVYANLTSGNIYYKVHYKGGYWLPEVKNRDDYAGLFNKPIDGLMMRTDTGKTLHYQVHLRRSGIWLPYVTGYNDKDSNNGYAGILGQEIDAIRAYIE